jgi:hypothetical protein
MGLRKIFFLLVMFIFVIIRWINKFSEVSLLFLLSIKRKRVGFVRMTHQWFTWLTYRYGVYYNDYRKVIWSLIKGFIIVFLSLFLFLKVYVPYVLGGLICLELDLDTGLYILVWHYWLIIFMIVSKVYRYIIFNNYGLISFLVFGLFVIESHFDSIFDWEGGLRMDAFYITLRDEYEEEDEYIIYEFRRQFGIMDDELFFYRMLGDDEFRGSWNWNLEFIQYLIRDRRIKFRKGLRYDSTKYFVGWALYWYKWYLYDLIFRFEVLRVKSWVRSIRGKELLLNEESWKLWKIAGEVEKDVKVVEDLNVRASEEYQFVSDNYDDIQVVMLDGEVPDELDIRLYESLNYGTFIVFFIGFYIMLLIGYLMKRFYNIYAGNESIKESIYLADQIGIRDKYDLYVLRVFYRKVRWLMKNKPWFLESYIKLFEANEFLLKVDKDEYSYIDIYERLNERGWISIEKKNYVLDEKEEKLNEEIIEEWDNSLGARISSMNIYGIPHFMDDILGYIRSWFEGQDEEDDIIDFEAKEHIYVKLALQDAWYEDWLKKIESSEKREGWRSLALLETQVDDIDQYENIFYNDEDVYYKWEDEESELYDNTFSLEEQFEESELDEDDKDDEDKMEIYYQLERQFDEESIGESQMNEDISLFIKREGDLEDTNSEYEEMSYRLSRAREKNDKEIDFYKEEEEEDEHSFLRNMIWRYKWYIIKCYFEKNKVKIGIEYKRIFNLIDRIDWEKIDKRFKIIYKKDYNEIMKYMPWYRDGNMMVDWKEYDPLRGEGEESEKIGYLIGHEDEAIMESLLNSREQILIEAEASTYEGSFIYNRWKKEIFKYIKMYEYYLKLKTDYINKDKFSDIKLERYIKNLFTNKIQKLTKTERMLIKINLKLNKRRFVLGIGQENFKERESYYYELMCPKKTYYGYYEYINYDDQPDMIIDNYIETVARHLFIKIGNMIKNEYNLFYKFNVGVIEGTLEDLRTMRSYIGYSRKNKRLALMIMMAQPAVEMGILEAYKLIGTDLSMNYDEYEYELMKQPMYINQRYFVRDLVWEYNNIYGTLIELMIKGELRSSNDAINIKDIRRKKIILEELYYYEEYIFNMKDENVLSELDFDEQPDLEIFEPTIIYGKVLDRKYKYFRLFSEALIRTGIQEVVNIKDEERRTRVEDNEIDKDPLFIKELLKHGQKDSILVSLAIDEGNKEKIKLWLKMNYNKFKYLYLCYDVFEDWLDEKVGYNGLIEWTESYYDINTYYGFEDECIKLVQKTYLKRYQDYFKLYDALKIDPNDILKTGVKNEEDFKLEFPMKEDKENKLILEKKEKIIDELDIEMGIVYNYEREDMDYNLRYDKAVFKNEIFLDLYKKFKFNFKRQIIMDEKKLGFWKLVNKSEEDANEIESVSYQEVHFENGAKQIWKDEWLYEWRFHIVDELCKSVMANGLTSIVEENKENDKRVSLVMKRVIEEVEMCKNLLLIKMMNVFINKNIHHFWFKGESNKKYNITRRGINLRTIYPYWIENDWFFESRSMEMEWNLYDEELCEVIKNHEDKHGESLIELDYSLQNEVGFLLGKFTMMEGRVEEMNYLGEIDEDRWEEELDEGYEYSIFRDDEDEDENDEDEKD